MPESILTFLIKGALGLLIYGVIYTWALNGRGLQAFDVPIFTHLRKATFFLVLLILSILFTAVTKNRHFYQAAPVIYKEEIKAPATLLSLEKFWKYKVEGADKLLLITSVFQGDGNIVYQASKSIDFPKNGRFSFNYATFANAPKIFDHITVESDGERLSLNHNGELRHKGQYDDFRQGWATLSKHSIQECSIQTPVFNYANRDPWYRRLFALRKQSVNMQQKTYLYTVPYKSSEPLVPFKVEEHIEVFFVRDEVNEYLIKNLQSTQAYSKSLPPRLSYNIYDYLNPHNFLMPLSGMYTIYVFLFLCLCFLGRGKIIATIIVAYLSIFVMLSCDYLLLQDRLKAIHGKETSSHARKFALVDLHNTTIFRKIAEKAALKILTKYNKELRNDSTWEQQEIQRLSAVSWMNLLHKNIIVEGGYGISLVSNRLNTSLSVYRHEKKIAVGFPSYRFFPFALKLIEKEGAYMVSSHFNVYHFQDFNLERCMSIKPSEPLQNQVRKLAKELKKNKQASWANDLLQNNEIIRFSLIYHLFTPGDVSPRYSHKIIEVSKKQQIAIIKNRIDRMIYDED
ncbi:MAG: hypothetical protein HRT88_13270 [Lentisphaeraceae bacterium]|nr:hypothetical protein [Lentisphaeraceae bacterium]